MTNIILITCWVVMTLGVVFIGYRQVTLWWRVQDLEQRLIELMKERQND